MKNKNVLFLGLALILVVAIILVIVFIPKGAKNEAEKSVEGFFSILKSTEESAKRNELLGKTAGSESSSDSLNYNLMFKDLSYSIKSSKVNGDEAEVTISVINKDMKKVMESYTLKAFTIALSSSESYDEEKVKEKLSNCLKEILESSDIEKVTTEVTLKLAKADNEWKIKEELQLDFVNAVLPGFMEYIKSFGEDLEEGM